MDMFEKRRRLLLGQFGEKFIIFLNELLAGEVLESFASEISSERINIKSGEKSFTAPIGFAYPTWRSMDEVLTYAEGQGWDVTHNYTVYESDGVTPRSFVIEVTSTSEGSGYLTIGSYDFTKYKKLKFTVENYTVEGTDASVGYVAFGDVVKSITADGSYSIKIKDYEGEFDITFSNDLGVQYSVNNVYLEG